MMLEKRAGGDSQRQAGKGAGGKRASCCCTLPAATHRVLVGRRGLHLEGDALVSGVLQKDGMKRAELKGVWAAAGGKAAAAAAIGAGRLGPPSNAKVPVRLQTQLGMAEASRSHAATHPLFCAGPRTSSAIGVLLCCPSCQRNTSLCGAMSRNSAAPFILTRCTAL